MRWNASKSISSRKERVQTLRFWGLWGILQPMLNPKEKEKTIENYKVHKTDSGSPEVQVALLSEEIRRLLLHLKKHAKDFHSKRGLLKMVARRRTLLSHLKREDEKRYNSLIRKVGLKK